MMIKSPILVVLLIATMASASVGNVAWAETDHAARVVKGGSGPACHGHSSKTSSHTRLPESPAPVSYQCCLNGHDAAVVQTSALLQPLEQSSGLNLQREIALLASSLLSFAFREVFTSQPPGASPLRI